MLVGERIKDLASTGDTRSTRLTVKRKLSLKVHGGGASTYSVHAHLRRRRVVWTRLRRCDVYRRVDLAAWTVADILYEPGKGNAPQSYAYIAP